MDEDDASINSRNFVEEEELQESKIIKLEISQAPALMIPTEENEPITSKIIPIDDVPTPIDTIENIKLESIVNKTIVNDNNVFDVPLGHDDQLLEEVEQRMSVTEPQPESTMDFEKRLTTHPIVEPTVETPNVDETLTTKPTTTVSIADTEIDHSPNSIPMTSPPETDENDGNDDDDESETVLMPSPNESTNNEVVNFENLEQSSIETTTIMATTASNTVKLVDAIDTTTSTVSQTFPGRQFKAHFADQQNLQVL